MSQHLRGAGSQEPGLHLESSLRGLFCAQWMHSTLLEAINIWLGTGQREKDAIRKGCSPTERKESRSDGDLMFLSLSNLHSNLVHSERDG